MTTTGHVVSIRSAEGTTIHQHEARANEATYNTLQLTSMVEIAAMAWADSGAVQ